MGNYGPALAFAGVALTVLAAVVGHVLSRRSAKDDDVREWVELRMNEQNAEIGRLRERLSTVETQLDEEKRTSAAERRAAEVERVAASQERLRVVSLTSYVRVLLHWIGENVPELSPPAAYGLVREALSDG